MSGSGRVTDMPNYQTILRILTNRRPGLRRATESELYEDVEMAA